MEALDLYSEKPTLDDTIYRQLISDLGEEPSLEGGTLILLIGDYRCECRKHLEDIRLAIAQGDSPLLRRAAHTLKSSSAIFGAVRLSAMAKLLEEIGRSGSLEGASEWVTPIETEMEKVLTLLPYP